MQRFLIIAIFVSIMFSCKKTETPVPVIENPVGILNLIESFSLDVTEPSGLSFGPDNNTLLTVSDNTNTVFELNMQGDIIRELDYTGKDLEGVTYNPDENLIVVAEEADREITMLNYSSGDEVGNYKININVGASNSGLEGVSYNMNNKLYYIAKQQKQLKKLKLELSGIQHILEKHSKQ